MAKNPQKTNTLGMELTPDSFGVKNEERGEVKPVQPVQPMKTKSLTRNISITLQEQNIEKLNRLAEEQDISKSKLIDRLISSL